MPEPLPNPEEAGFYPFPKTLHLPGSSVVDDDDTDQAFYDSILKALKGGGRRLVVQEKVDGTNASVHFLPGRTTPTCQKRSGVIVPKKSHEQYQAFDKFCQQRAAELYDGLGDRYVLFGEWVWWFHALAYDNLPQYFIPFDLFDKESGVFLPYTELEAMCQGLGLPTVPVVYATPPLGPAHGSGEGEAGGGADDGDGSPASGGGGGEYEHTGDDVPSLAELRKIAHGRSIFSTEHAREGVYVRLEDAHQVIGRGKLRRKLENGREDFNRKVLNQLAGP